MLVLIAIVAVIAYVYWPRTPEPADTQPPAEADHIADLPTDGARRDGSDDGAGPATREDDANDNDGAEPTPPATQAARPELPALTRAQAVAAYEEGVSMHAADELIGARTALSRAVLSYALPAAEARDARGRLEAIAQRTLFSRVALADDPYTTYYEFKPGEVLAGRNGVVRRLELRVPERLIVEINGLNRAQDIQAGRSYKVIRGPFHAVVDKSEFVMDLYLQRGDLPPVFIRRAPVGLGRNGSTPSGLWRVKRGGKETRATWYPPPSSPIHKAAVPYDDPDYAFGEKGLWIALEGMDPQTAPLTSYGIHSTNDPSSVGKESSLGCIRLKDADIERVFSLLYPVHSTVKVVD